MFVFSGLIPICAGEDGLAAVLGHEIAHNVAHHTAERLSQAAILFPIGLLVSLFDLPSNLVRAVFEFVYSRPGSRKQEVCHIFSKLDFQVMIAKPPSPSRKRIS